MQFYTIQIKSYAENTIKVGYKRSKKGEIARSFYILLSSTKVSVMFSDTGGINVYYCVSKM